jgi:RecB family exonuclease
VVERDLRTPQPVLPVKGEGGEKPEQEEEPKQEEEPLLSFSAINAYRECPRQHWYRYRLRLPTTPGVEAQFGTAIHLVLMRAGRLRAEGREVTPDLLRELLDEAWDTIALSEPRRRPALEALSRRLLGRFLSAGGLDAPPRLVEAPFAISQDGWTLRGVIDRVDPPLDGSRAWRIIDYTTGSPVPASRLRRDLQLALYALGARQALGLDPVVLEIVYLKDGQRVIVPATEELLAQARQIGTEVADGIRCGRFEPRPERRRCSLCGYRLACEAAL